MAKAPQTAVVADAIVFELERFELSDEDRLQLAGRWFGVRGRRFVRPTLTLDVDGERIRALADLDDKPWAAEDGEPWAAAFPWHKPAPVDSSELSVAPDITIQLPAPSSRRTRSQRLTALPRRDAMTASWGDLAPAIQAEPDVAEAPAAPPEPAAEPPPPENPPVVEANAAAAALTATLASQSDELEAAQAELAAAQTELQTTQAELAAVQAELAATRAAREAALRSAAQAEAERDTALTRAEEAEAERDALLEDNASLSSRLEQSQATVERVGRERDEALASRGAALVMRGATQALPAYERHVGWHRRALAVLVLVGAGIAALIVLNVL